MQEAIQTFLLAHPLLAPLLYVVIRPIPIVIAPIPGIVVDLAGAYVFGWKFGLVLGEIGILIGSSIAFLVARYFRGWLMSRFSVLQKAHKWESYYSEKQKFWSLVFLRLTTSPFFDYISYAAGLTRMSFKVFFLSTLIGTFPIMFINYYFGGVIFEKGMVWLGLAGFAAIAFISVLLAKRVGSVKLDYATKYIGKSVVVEIDRPLGSKHPKWGFEYPVNYGFIPGTAAPDGSEVDAYVLGVSERLSEFAGEVIAVIEREDDEDDKVVVVSRGTSMSGEEIMEAVHFQEKWFKSKLIWDPPSS